MTPPPIADTPIARLTPPADVPELAPEPALAAQEAAPSMSRVVTKAAEPGESRPVFRPESAGLFRVVWRWHFYAGLLIAPLLIAMSITGGLYIFKNEILNTWRRQLVYVEPGLVRVPYQSQIDAALSLHPQATLVRLRAAPTPELATIVTLRPTASTSGAASHPAPAATQSARTSATSKADAPRPTVDVYVDPYTGGVLGQVASTATPEMVFATILKLHRTLWAGTTGRILNELATSWSVVLLITGVYLWWPRKTGRSAGVWTLRWKAKLYTVLRDLHSVPGLYFVPICAIIVVTGMFYTVAVGKVVHDAAHAWVGEPEEAAVASKAGAGFRAKTGLRDSAEQTGDAPSPPPSRSIDELLGVVREQHPDRFLSATFSTPRATSENTIAIKAINDIYRTYGPMRITDFTLDKATGAVAKSVDGSQTAHFWHNWTYPLHVGSVYGLTTKILWLLACVMLVVLPVTGAWMWWERRPRGRSGFPRRPETKVPRWLVGLILALCIVLPVMGASVVLILLGEAIYRRFRRLPQSATPT